MFIFTSGKRRYGVKLWKIFTECFNCLPIAAIIDEKIFCMHGGLSPDLKAMEQIRRVVRPTDVPDTGLHNLKFFTNILFQVCCAICCGPTQIKTFKDGGKMTGNST